MTSMPGKRIGSNAGVGVGTTRRSTKKDASACSSEEEEEAAQTQRRGAHSKKSRSNQFRDGAALPQPQTGQLDEVAEVEHGVRSLRLRGAKIEDLTLQLVFEDTLGAPSSSAWQHTQKLRAKLCAILGSGLPANTCGAGWQTSLWPRAKGVP